MKQTIMHWLKKEGIYFLLSFFLPFLIMALAYAAVGVYWGSELTILASDAYSQGANFLASFNDMLHGKASPFYSWSGSLGLYYWALSAYYLNGIFTPLVYFFDNSQIPDVMYLLTLIKFGAMGGAFWCMGRQLFRLPQLLLTALSLGYALCAFPIASSPMLMWLDAMMYLPLVILGIHRLVGQRRPLVLFISYLLLFLTNFYMAFMVGVFSFLYMLGLVLLQPKVNGRQLPLYFLTAFLAGGASMIIILPTILDLMNNGEGLTSIQQFLTPDTGPWDLIVKNMTGIYDTTRFSSAPFISFGLLGLPFATAYFFLKEIPLRNKLVFGGLGLILIASVYIYPLNLFWQGFHAPNMFLFRFAFLFSFLGALLAGWGMEALHKENFNGLANAVILWIALFCGAVWFANRKRYDYVSRTTLIISITFLLLYLGLFWAKKHRTASKWAKWLLPLIIVAASAEGLYQATYLLKGFNTDWGYPPRELYEKDYADIKQLVTLAKKETPDFHRLETLDYGSTNQSFKYGYSGVGMFSSIRNRRSSSYLDQLGFRSTGSNLRVEYGNNTLLMDALFGVRYNITKQAANKYGFQLLQTAGDFHLYQNRYALPLGVLTNEAIYTDEAAQTQESLLQQLSDRKASLFSFTEPEMVKKEDVSVIEENGMVTFNETTVGKVRKVTYQVRIPANGQAYLMLYGEHSAGMRDAVASVEVNGINRSGGLVTEGQFFDLGYYDQEETTTATVTFSGNTHTTLRKPTVIILDTEKYAEAVTAAQAKDGNLQVNGRKVTANLTAEKGQVLFTSIPYDKGWRLTVNGQEQGIKAFQEALITVQLTEGANEIELSYLPQGFQLGAGLFIGCTSLFFASEYYRRHKSRQGVST